MTDEKSLKRRRAIASDVEAEVETIVAVATVTSRRAAVVGNIAHAVLLFYEQNKGMTTVNSCEVCAGESVANLPTSNDGHFVRCLMFACHANYPLDSAKSRNHQSVPA